MEKFSNLNWSVEKVEMTAGNLQTPYFATVRQDTQTVLGCVGDGYVLTQNSETLEILQKIAKDKNYDIQKSYCIDGGKRIVIQIRLDEKIKIADDTLVTYVNAMDSHDGSTRLCFGGSDTVMSCQNQFYRFYKSSKYQVSHTKNSKMKIEQILKSLEQLNKIEELHYNLYRQFTTTKVSRDLAVEAILRVMELEEMPTNSRSLNLFEKIDYAVTSEMLQKGQTAWGLFNGFTYYSNHIKTGRENTVKENSLITGSDAYFNNKALREVSKLLV